MKILLTNDDGYQSTGLMLLCSKLAEKGHEVVVVAPDSQRSAFSHAVNFYKNVTVTPLENYCGAVKAFTCSGSPADCVKFAEWLPEKFDLLISGPNNGENYGSAILYSGTVGAAEEGVLCGIKSIALSRLGYGGAYGSTVEYVAENVEQLAGCISMENTLLNVNVPNLPMDQIKGVKVCRQSLKQLFHDYFEPTETQNVYFVTGDRLPIDDVECDIDFAEKGYITITPVTVDSTAYQYLQQLKVLEK